MMYNVKDVALLNPDRIIIWLCSFSWDSIDFLRIFQLFAFGFQTEQWAKTLLLSSNLFPDAGGSLVFLKKIWPSMT